jgi:hypothetical protein
MQVQTQGKLLYILFSNTKNEIKSTVNCHSTTSYRYYCIAHIPGRYFIISNFHYFFPGIYGGTHFTGFGYAISCVCKAWAMV